MRRNLLYFLLPFLAVVATLRGGPIPIDETFRYPGYNLYYHLDAHGSVDDINQFPVQGNVLNFTMADAVKTAAFTWNVALALQGQVPNWQWIETNKNFPNAPFPHIHFRMSTILDKGLPTEREEMPPIPSSDYEAEMDKGPGGRGGPAATLAYFRLLTLCGDCVYEAEIVFNRNVPWGIDKSQTDPNKLKRDDFYDPIIVALHEMGHAMRLDHDLDPNDKIIGDPNINGNVIRPLLGKGVHSTNPTMVDNFLFARFPSVNDVGAASFSAALMQPCPESASAALMALGLLGLAWLRRRA